MLKIRSITRRYNDSTSSIRKETTARLANEIAEERVSRALTDAHNERVRERRSQPYYLRAEN